eukprot:365424-Chlamydomonas_euryale.AAC.8
MDACMRDIATYIQQLHSRYIGVWIHSSGGVACMKAGMPGLRLLWTGRGARAPAFGPICSNRQSRRLAIVVATAVIQIMQ